MRKSKPKKRILLPDPKFKNPEVTRFVNNLMLHGTSAKKDKYKRLKRPSSLTYPAQGGIIGGP